jgi:hypothetical protein
MNTQALSAQAESIQEGLATVAQSIVIALGHIQTAGGAEVAAHAAGLMIGLATQHLLTACGPQAARDTLIRVYADLQAEIEAQNSGSTAIN